MVRAGTKETNMSKEANRPDYRAYLVKGEKEKAFWQPIGAAWAHTDGKGITINLDALPLDGRITLREFTERENGGQQ
jgi:hypothetical protein